MPSVTAKPVSCLSESGWRFVQTCHICHADILPNHFSGLQSKYRSLKSLLGCWLALSMPETCRHLIFQSMKFLSSYPDSDTNSPGVCRPNCPSAHPAQGPSPSWIRNRMFMWSQRGRTGLLAPASRTASTTLPHSNCSLQYLRLPLLKKVHVFSPLLCWESEGTAALSSMLVEILCRSRIDWIKWVL